MTNSAASPPSNRATPAEIAAVLAALLLLIVAASWWCYRNGCLLYYGDAQAHIDISRSWIDSRTPGLDQLGTVWLPLLHVICLPFVRNNFLWSTGLAATIPVGLCFLVAGLCFFLCAQEAFRSSKAAFVVVACFALNPNILYLASIPMTEMVFLAGLAVLMFAFFRFRTTQKSSFVALALAAVWWMSLTRYDGWFLIPFAGLTLMLFAQRHRWRIFVGFNALASLPLAAWLAYNWWETSNPLDFYNGPYSPAAIQGGAWYPGYHDWILSFRYYFAAGRLCAGWPLLMLGAAGLICARRRKVLLPCLFLLLTPLFYVWNMHSSAAPIHVPLLPPFTYYNTRYGIAVVVAAAFAAGALALSLDGRPKIFLFIIPLLSVFPWLINPSRQNWICWKESDYNSVARRAWTVRAASFFEKNYVPGTGILASPGDVAGIFCHAKLPLSETLNIGNGPAWFATIARPDLLHQELWAVAQDHDSLSKQLERRGSPYQLIEQIEVKGAPALEIYKRHLK